MVGATQHKKARTIHHVYMGGVRVALSHRGQKVPQWLATAARERFPVKAEIALHEVQRFLREQLPCGSCTERDELASKFARVLRRLNVAHKQPVAG